MAIVLGEISRTLRELIAALDRRAPRIEQPDEESIAHDSASLRQKAVKRLAELADDRGAH
jgi:hypothetical protein